MPDSSYFGSAQAGLPSAPTGQFMPIMGQYKLTQDSLNKGIQNVTGAFDQGAAGPFKSLVNYVSGSGALQAGDDTGTLSLSPGGSFELKSPQGFSVTGNPVMKSLGMNVPVGGGTNRGTVGLQGSWGADPSIQANFQFGKPFPSVSSPEQAVDTALAPKDASYTYQSPFNTTSQQNWNIKNNTSKEDMAQSMWFAKGGNKYRTEFQPEQLNTGDERNPTPQEFLQKVISPYATTRDVLGGVTPSGQYKITSNPYSNY